jgi:hypothetical protein
MDHRREERIRSRLPIEVEPEGGHLIDMSRSGVAYQTPRRHAVGDPIDIHLVVGPLGSPGRLDLHCRGSVVRVTPCDKEWMIGGAIEWIEE